MGSLFTLGSSIFKFKLAFISLSPAVLLPALSLAISPSIRKVFLNENLEDKNFKYALISMLGFIILMFYQTIFSDWQDRALSELFKTCLFFITTHIFFSIIASSRYLFQSIRLSLFISIFLLHICHIFIFLNLELLILELILMIKTDQALTH